MAQIAVAKADTASEVLARCLLLQKFPLSVYKHGDGAREHYLIFVDRDDYYAALHVLRVSGVRTGL